MQSKWLFFCSGTISLILSVLPEFISDETKLIVKEWFGQYYDIKLSIIFLLCALVSFYLAWKQTNKENEETKYVGTIPAELFTQIKNSLIVQYQNRLDQKVAGRLPINLRRIDFTETAIQHSQKQYKEIDQSVIQGELIKFFTIAEGRLLILGAPGTGKTSLLLELAIALLNMKPDILTVVVNLESWVKEYMTLEEKRYKELMGFDDIEKEQRPTIEDWLHKVLAAELPVSKLPDGFLQKNRVILLFDGLDEIADVEKRKACLTEIDSFTSKKGQMFAISSRKQEFLDLNHFPIAFPIEIGHLTMQQIERELSDRSPNEPEDRDLLVALKNDKLLRDAAETPFYFNCLQLLFGENKKINFTSITREEREREVLEIFIKNELDKCKHKEAQSWLEFLSLNMQEKGLVRFELRDLQYDWYPKWKKSQIVTALSLSTIIENFILGLAIILALTGFGLYYSTTGAGLLAGLFSVFLLGVVNIFVNTISGLLDIYLFIYTKDKIKWSWKKFLHSAIYIQWFSFLIGIAYGTVAGLSNLLAFSLNLGGGFRFFFGTLGGLLLYKIATLDSEKLSWKKIKEDWTEEVVLPVLFGVFGGGIAIASTILPDFTSNQQINLFLSGLLGGVILWFGGLGIIGTLMSVINFDYVDIIQAKSPYFRFLNSAKNLHFSIFQHLLLRRQLSKKELIPFHLDKFLNEMASYRVNTRQFSTHQIHLLEVERGSWRFRHRLIQDWFVSPEREKT